MRSTPRFLVLAAWLSASATLNAQQPTPRPESDPVIVRRVPPPPGVPIDGQVQIITTRRAILGVSLDLRPRPDDSLGALIQSVTPNGPAARAGLRSGDLITTVNRIAIAMPVGGLSRDVSVAGIRLIELMSDFKPGDTLAVEYRRGKERRNAAVIAGEEPAIAWRTLDGGLGYSFGEGNPAAAEAMRRYTLQLETSPGVFESPQGPSRLDSMKVRAPMRIPAPMFTLTTPFANLELAPMNPELGRYFGVDNGVLVINIPAGSRLGLKPGDVVLSVDGREPAGPAHLVRILRSYQDGESFTLRIIRMKQRASVTGRVGE